MEVTHLHTFGGGYFTENVKKMLRNSICVKGILLHLEFLSVINYMSDT